MTVKNTLTREQSRQIDQRAIGEFARVAQLAAEDPQPVTSRQAVVALAYQAAGWLTEALPLFEETLKGLKAKLGLQHPLTLQIMNNLGTVWNGTS